MSKRTIQKVGWIIKHPKKGIWKQTYHSKSEAEAELASQTAMVKKTHPTFTGGDWKIESFDYLSSFDDSKEDGFKDFEGL